MKTERVVVLKKLILTFLFIILTFALPAAVFATEGEIKGEAKTELKLEEKADAIQQELAPFVFITSEKGDFQPDNEYSITFAGQITINAESVKGAKVLVTVTFDEALGEPPAVYDEVVIGASQKFIQPVALKLGDNLVEIIVEKEGFEKNVINTVIKRKDITIMESLQRLIIIPGQIKDVGKDIGK